MMRKERPNWLSISMRFENAAGQSKSLTEDTSSIVLRNSDILAIREILEECADGALDDFVNIFNTTDNK